MSNPWPGWWVVDFGDVLHSPLPRVGGGIGRHKVCPPRCRISAVMRYPRTLKRMLWMVMGDGR
eukprot:5658806-Prorocentrum_lima.AAC.1